MSEMEDRKMVLELLYAADAAILTTIGKEGYPQTTAMFNLRNKEMFPKLIPLFAEHDNDLMIVFTTNTSSSKVENIRSNSKISVYYYIVKQSQGAMLGGNVEIVEDLELKRTVWHEGWERYYLKGFDDPDHTVLRFYPKYVKGWNKSRTYRFEIG